MTNEPARCTGQCQELKAQVDELRAERDRLRAMVDALRPRPIDRESPAAECEYMVYTPRLGVTPAFLDINVPYGRQWTQGDWLISDKPTHFYPNPEPPGAWWDWDSARNE